MREKIMEIVRTQSGIDEVLLLNMLGGLEHRPVIDSLVNENRIGRLREKGRGVRLYLSTVPLVDRIRPSARRPKRTQEQIAADAKLTFRVYQLERRVAELEALLKP
jgi:uncharacterized protein YceH (UPF0502 family)